MLIALDKNNNRIHSFDAQKGERYFCPICGDELVYRHGEIKIPHFAHQPKSVCNDNWHYDMTEWHYDWQNRFPKECQEVVKTFNGQKHRADVLLENEKIVFEFQHSPLSCAEFEERNNFYNSLGYKVVWVFDVEELYENESIENYDYNKWSWKRAKTTFENFDPRGKNLLFLQINNDEPDDELVFVKWCTDEGLKRFATDGCSYYMKDIVHMFDKTKYGDVGTNVKFADLYDKLITVKSTNHGFMYFGCPISPTNKCADNNIDLTDEECKSIYPCSKCKYSEWADDGKVCYKRFKDLNIPGYVEVKIDQKNKNGFITKLSYLKDGKKETIELDAPEKPIFKSVYKIWEEKNLKVGIFKNINSKKYIKIVKDPSAQYQKYRKVYGYYSFDEYDWPEKSVELFGLNEPVWIDVWSKPKDDE